MDNEAFLKSLGATHVIDYKSDVAKAVMEITQGKGVNYICESVSSATATQGI